MADNPFKLQKDNLYLIYLDPPSTKVFFYFFIIYIVSSSKQAGDGTERENIHERESNFKVGNVVE